MMPSVFLGKPTVEYLKSHSNGESMDATVRRLLKLDEGTNGLVRRQIPREKLAPAFAYTWTILNQLRAYDQANPQMERSELQKKVGETMGAFGLFDIFPDDGTLVARKQPRWKQRFTNALSYLKKRGCVEDIGKASDAPKWESVQYRATDHGLSVIEDIGLHLDLKKELPATQKGPSIDGHCYLYTVSESTRELDADGNSLCPKPLEPASIPSELSGRPASPPLLEEGWWKDGVPVVPKTPEEQRNRSSQEILSEFQAQGYEIDDSHASLGMVYTQKEKDEDAQSPQA
jgi:hypothetical protein